MRRLTPCLVSISLAFAAVGTTSSAASAPVPVWTAQASANPTADPNNQAQLEGVSVSSSVGWAVGLWVSSARRGHSLIERLTPSGWVDQSVGLLSGNNELDAVDTISKNNAWAVGYHQVAPAGGDGASSGVLVLHYDGTKWAHVAAPHETIHKTTATAGPAYSLSAITALSSRNIWAVGDASCESIECRDNPLTEHYNGKVWTQVKAPNPAGDTSFVGVAGLNSTHVWAAASNLGNGKSYIYGYNGKDWHTVTIPEPGVSNSLNAVTAHDSKSIWAVGSEVTRAGNTKPEILRRVNGVWTLVSSPHRGAASFLNSVVAISDKNVWAVGASFADDTSHTLIEHWDGHSWSIVASPNPAAFGVELLGVAAQPDGTSYAVGEDQVGDSGMTTYAASTGSG
jgi:hypothetical protein